MRRLAGIAVAAWSCLASPVRVPAQAAGEEAAPRLSIELPDLDVSAGRAFAVTRAASVASWLAPSILGEIPPAEPRSWAFELGLGFTADPTTFLSAFEVDRFVNDMFAVGALLQVAGAGSDFIIAPTVHVKAMIDLPVEGFEMVKPTAQFGLGFLYRDHDGRNRSDDDIGFLMNFGLGVQYFVTEQFAVGTNFLFNVLPDGVLGEHFLFGWEVVTLRFQM